MRKRSSQLEHLKGTILKMRSENVSYDEIKWYLETAHNLYMTKGGIRTFVSRSKRKIANE